MNGLTIDTERRIVRLDGRLIELSRQEYNLLTKLYEDPTRCFSKDELVRHLWRWSADAEVPETRVIDTMAYRLRQKLDRRFVVNVWGVGYRLTRPVEVEEVRDAA